MMAGKTGPPYGSGLIVASLLIFTACAGSGHVVGRVTTLEDGALAGARITIDGLKRHEEITADATGHFDFTDVTPGTYKLKADVPGFVMEMRDDVSVARDATATVDFVLHPACLEEGSYVDGGLTWALQAAEAVVRLRIVGATPPDRWIVNDLCVVGMDHTVTVLSILNMSRDSASIPRTIHIVKDGRMPYAPGDEYIAFLRWEAAIGRYRPIAGPIFMLPVRDDKVAWARTDAPNIHDGDPAGKALASLFALLGSIRAAR